MKPNNLPRMLKKEIFSHVGAFNDIDQLCDYLNECAGDVHATCGLTGKDLGYSCCTQKEIHSSCPFLGNGNEDIVLYGFVSDRTNIDITEEQFKVLLMLAGVKE